MNGNLNNIINLHRGDTFAGAFFINAGNNLNPQRYILTENDTLYFAIMEPNQLFEDAIVKKVYTHLDEQTEEHDIYIKLTSQDTENLLPGVYYYTIKLRQVSETPGEEDNVTTLIPQRKFCLLS